MKVALLSLHYAEYSIGYARALAKHHDVLLVAERGNVSAEMGHALTSDELGFQVRYVDWRKKPASIVECARDVVAALREFRPDVVHAQETLLDFHALLIPYLARRPLVLTVHDPSPHSGEKLSSLGRRRHWFQSAHRSAADRIVVHGDGLRDALVAAMPSARDKVRVLRHGVLGTEPGDGAVRPHTPGRLLFLGRMQAYKGLPVFAEAVRSLHDQGLDVRGVVAGKGPALDEISAELAAHPAFEVHDMFLPRQTMIDLVDDADAVVLPYLDGTQSGVAALALGRGRALVASRVGSLPDMVRDGENGLLVPAGDAAALADAMGSIVRDQSLGDSFRERAQVLGQTEFAWDSIAERAGEVYAEVVRA